MDYEKAYKNALEWARQVMEGKTGFIRKEVEDIFPELKESNDERVRMWLIAQLKIKSSDDNPHELEDMINKSIAWLERQGVQKPTWSEEDEHRTKNAIFFLEVDLKKEIDNIWNPRFNLGWDEKSLLSVNHEGFTTIAKHFYELGLKSIKGRNNYCNN